jgi:hypothetical protein
MLLVPKLIAREVALFELKIPVVRSKPFKFKVPLVNVDVPVAAIVNVEFNDVVPAPVLIVNVPNVVFPLDVIAPVPT